MPSSSPGLWSDTRRSRIDDPPLREHRLLPHERAALEPPPPPPRRGRLASIVAAVFLSLVGATAGVVALVTVADDDQAAPASVSLGGVPRTDIGRVYAAAGPAVTSVQSQQDSGTATGTGFLVATDGTVVTNAHVVGDAETVQVRFGDTGRILRAEVLGTDPSSDLAVLSVGARAAEGIRPLRLADSNSVAVGDQAIAVGHPFGLDRTATAGIVSGLGREIQAPNGFQIDEVIQTDAPINPGNSGGPLLDLKARVIGVNSQIASAGGGNVGVGFAVPSNTVRDVLPRLRQGLPIRRPYLGVATAPAPGGGAAVQEVTPGGPAERAGIRAGQDKIVGVAGRDVREPDDVAAAIAGLQPGDRVEVRVERDGKERTLSVELDNRP